MYCMFRQAFETVPYRVGTGLSHHRTVDQKSILQHFDFVADCVYLNSTWYLIEPRAHYDAWPITKLREATMITVWDRVYEHLLYPKHTCIRGLLAC